MILLRIFKDSRLKGTGAMILLLLGIFTPSFILDFSKGGSPGYVSGAHAASSGMPFYNLIFGAIHTVPVISHLLAMLVLLLISYLLVRIGVRDQLLQERSVMPAIFFIFFTAAIPAARVISPELIGSLFYILCFIMLFEVQDKKPDTLSIFSASLVLALGSMFYLKLFWFIPLIWVSLWTMRQVSWRELLYPLLAYVFLLILLFAWYWGVLDNYDVFKKLLLQNLPFEGGFQAYHYSVYLLYGFIVFLVGLASIYMVNRFQSRKTMVQNIYQVMFYMFLAGLLFFTLIARFDPATLVFIAFPVSFILSNYFHRRKSPWIHELAMWILLGLVIFVQVMV